VAENVPEIAPATNGSLTKCKAALWPASIEKTFGQNHLHFHTLLDYARARGVKPETTEYSFLVTFRFDFVGFEKVKDVWKIVFEIKERVSLELLEVHLKTPVPGISLGFKRDLRYMVETPSERLMNLPCPVEEVTVKETVRGREHTEKFWHFVGEPIRRTRRK